MNKSNYREKRSFADDLGVTEPVIEGWIRRHWEKGYHYVVIGHTTLIEIKRVEKWINERGLQASDRAEMDSESDLAQRQTHPLRNDPLRPVQCE